jgi:formamidopyrimidine-DNA glycosylase
MKPNKKAQLKNYSQVDLNNYVLESNDPKHHKFYKDQNHCCFCGHELKILSSKKIGQRSVDETAFCPSCQENIIVKKHGVQ